MADGYIETATDILMFLKTTGLSDHDVEAVGYLDSVLEDVVKQLMRQRVTKQRTVRRAYGTGFIHGLKFAAEMTQLHLRKLRADEGRDPDTGLHPEVPS